MRALLLTTVLPDGRRTGGEVVSDSVVAALRAAGHDVLIVGYRRPGEAHADGLCVGRRPIETSDAGVRSLAWMARALLTHDAYSRTKYRSHAYVRAARDALESSDAVVVDHAQVGFALDAARTPVVFVAHNVERTLHARLAGEAGGALGRAAHRREARLIGAAEDVLARRAQQVWTLTAADAEHFRSRAGDVRTLPVAPSFVDPPPARPPAYDVALLGTWTWEANAAGLEWFLRDVLPRLPDATTVAIAGAGSERWAGARANVSARGVVADAASFLAQAGVVAVPSTAGAGVQVKTLDAIASGVPVVATSVAARGLTNLPASITVADGADGFAAALGASGAERATVRAEAAAWARRRREQFDASVARWVGELSAR